MVTFIPNNIGTIITALVLLAIVTVIIAKVVRDRRKGKCIGCPCGCGGCSDQPGCGIKG